MVNYHIKTTWRHLIKNKAFSLINVTGLALGLACSLLIFLWVQDERHVDADLAATKATYAVYERVFSEGKVETAHSTPGMLAVELKRKIPGIRYASGFWSAQEIRFSVGEKRGEKSLIEKGAFADSDYFKIFRYPLLQGTAAGALQQPQAIALSKKMAVAFFGSPEAAFGQTIRYNNLADLKVSAVFEDVPANSAEKFDYVINWQYLLESVGWLTNWINRSPATFIQLQPNTDPATVQAQIKDFIQPYLGTGYGAGFRTELGLQRFDQIYLYSTFKDGVPDGGRIEYVRLFSLIALFILLVACINFMNLATARSAKRAKEVGIRKTIGARRPSLILQFIAEAMLLAVLAFVLALGLVALIMPVFNQVTGKQIALPVTSMHFWLDATLLLIATGVVAGSYPALYLSSLVPLKVLKGALTFSPGALLFRKGLVVFQFVLCIVFIVATIIISKQVRYVQEKNLGFDRENLVYVPMERSLAMQYPLLKSQLAVLPGVASVSYSNQIPTEIGSHVYDLSWEGKDPAAKVVAMHNGVGYDYVKAMHLTMRMGRDFSRDFPTDTVGYVINETALKMIGYKDPIGRLLVYFGHRGKIIGVVKDFNFQSLHDPIRPLVLEFMGERISWDGSYAIVRVAPGQTKQALAGIERTCKSLDPAFPFRYTFADAAYQTLYTSELTVSSLSDSFALLAICISCLGLLGLTMFTAEQRRKEIGIRKIIGASAGNIVTLLSKDMLKLVAISAVIATPVAWLAMSRWLQNFAFHIDIDWWVFLLAGLIAVLIALATIAYQAIKTALENPINSLRPD
jgi:putative ABC transport system permease protein